MSSSIDKNLKKAVSALCSVFPMFEAATSLNWNYGNPSQTKYLGEFIDDSDINWSTLKGKEKGEYFVRIFSDLILQDLLDDELDAFEFVGTFFNEIFDSFIPEDDQDTLKMITESFTVHKELKKGNETYLKSILLECENRKKDLKIMGKEEINQEEHIEKSIQIQNEIEQEKQEKKEKGTYLLYIKFYLF